MNQQHFASIEAERDCLLSCMFGSPTDLETVASSLTEKDFSSFGHRAIFDIVQNRFRRYLPCGFGHIIEAIEVKPNGQELAKALVDMRPEDFLTSASLRQSINVVKTKARLRAIQAFAQDVASFVQSNDANDTMQMIEDRLLALTDDSNEETTLTSAFAKLIEVAEDRKRRFETGQPMPGIPTPITELNTVLNAFQPGQFIIVAARPGLGKSSLACNFVTHAIKAANVGAYFASLEMSDLELAERIAADTLELNSDVIRKGTLTDQQMQMLINQNEEIATWQPMIINDSPNQTVMQIRAAARRHKQKSGIGVVVVDYLQLIDTANKRGGNRAEQVAQMSRQLKIMAKELQMPVIALSQLNRVSEARSDQRPKLSDLRESGAIEQDADVVLLLHFNEAKEAKIDRSGKLLERPKEAFYEIIIAKQRAGNTCSVRVEFQKEFSRFVGERPPIATFGESAIDY